MGTARDSCCACSSIMPATCDDAYFHSKLATQHKACEPLVSALGSYAMGCEARLSVAFADEKLDYYFPDKAVTVAAVCPRTCGLCDGAVTASFAPAWVTFTATLAGTVASFDETAQASYKSGLASLLAGISASEIELEVSAGSVTVVATIKTLSARSLQLTTAMSGLTAASLSTATGFTVQQLAAPVVSATEPVPAPASPPPPAPTVDTSLVVGLSLGVGGVALLILANLVVYALRRNKRAQVDSHAAAKASSTDSAEA